MPKAALSSPLCSSPCCPAPSAPTSSTTSPSPVPASPSPTPNPPPSTIFDFDLWSNYSTGVTATVNGTPNINISADYFSVFFPRRATSSPSLSAPAWAANHHRRPGRLHLYIVSATNPPPYFQEDIVGTFVPGTYTESTTPTAPGQNPVAYTQKNTQEATSTSATPEPSSLLLLATGALTAGTHLRRRRRG